MRFETKPDRIPAGIGAARRVLQLEAEGIVALADTLDSRFCEAAERLAGIDGRVVVTGIGKSGHVARKIAATLSSTGTPALFVHPAEASHGDLGMITGADAVLALSNSGETPELSPIVTFARRLGIPFVAITRRARSTLGVEADVALVLPANREACPMGLAPTTSTTMMLALGDALAIFLLERKGFSADQFQDLHPGGALGRRLLRVSDIMHVDSDLPLVAPDTPMSEAILVITEKRLGCAGIVGEAKRLAGIITDGDLRRHMAADLLSQPASSVMTANPKTIRPNALAAEALGILNQQQIQVLFVVEGGRPVGLLHIHDCLRAGIA
jgi:arabinose-5-phosphate isomerase